MKSDQFLYVGYDTMLQQMVREKRARDGYWKTKPVRVMTSYHEDPTKRFYKYVEKTFWVPSMEEQLVLKKENAELIARVVEAEYKKAHPTSFVFTKRYPHPW
jgi:hypothetical protein